MTIELMCLTLCLKDTILKVVDGSAPLLSHIPALKSTIALFNISIELKLLFFAFFGRGFDSIFFLLI